MDTYGDSDWHYHIAITKIWALLAAKLVETPVFAFNATDYADGLYKYLDSAKEKAEKSILRETFSFQPLEKAIMKLHEASTKFEEYTASLTARLGEDVPWWKWWQKVRLYYEIRRANDRYKLLERRFLHAEGLDGRPWFKHVVFAPGIWTGYAGATYPGLVESIETGNSTNAERWRDIIVGKVHDATKLLK